MVPLMKDEVAERLAAAEVGIKLSDAQKVIKAFMEHLAICPVCAGRGNYVSGAQF